MSGDEYSDLAFAPTIAADEGREDDCGGVEVDAEDRCAHGCTGSVTGTLSLRDMSSKRTSIGEM